MLVVLADEPGAPFRIVEIDKPRPERGQVLVRIQASGVNPLDVKIRAGQAPMRANRCPPSSGSISRGRWRSSAPRSSRSRWATRSMALPVAWGDCKAPWRSTRRSTPTCSPSSRPTTFREAAALPLVFITAWEGLVDRAGVCGGRQVLVHGGAGGVGHIAVQLARAFGATVFATGSAQDRALIEALGATAIDYRNAAVEQYVAEHTSGLGFDIVYDTVGGSTLDASFQAVRRFGHVVSSLGWGTHALAPLSFRAASYSGVFALLPMLTGAGRAHHGEILRRASALVDAGKITPRVDPAAVHARERGCRARCARLGLPGRQGRRRRRGLTSIRRAASRGQAPAPDHRVTAPQARERPPAKRGSTRSAPP